ncbi:hypothetical protein B9G98_04558 [Wickerhamiella sorbophila]|uniref:Golgi to ER traffic protein 2 n=1 Tax=Wickerhamiella sorbophila TaxID=45607 RepID=A0A2T0FPM9_9ASCO|nr:hypothetical protein B9G98_04558 [Wickerhamiella sorbophila]PRT56938.1 hypothetical protein B9G98_04558 [Wickerhamiella sorbophila]
MSDNVQSARERRQARIREGAADRLAKITGSAGRSFQTESESRQFNRKPTSQLGKPESSSPEHHDDPPDVLPSDLDKPQTQSEDRFADDPLFKMLSQMQSNLNQDGSGGPGAFNFDFSDLVAQKLSAAQSVEDTPAAQAQRARSQRFQTAVHIILMVLVGLYASWNTYMLLSIFTTVEVVLTVAFSFSAPPARQSMFSPFVVYLPAVLQRPVRLLLANEMVIRQTYRDFCLVLLVYGLLHAYDGTDATSIHYRVPVS